MRPNGDRAKNAIKMMWMMLAASVLLIPVSIYTINFAIGVNDNYGYISQDEALAFAATVGIFGLIHTVVYIVAAVLFIQWFRRAYFNLHTLIPSGLKYTEGWAAGAWFIPIFNLFGPYQIATDLFTKTEGLLVDAGLTTPQPKRHLLKGWWWGLWISGNILSQVSGRIEGSSDALLISVGISIFGLLLTIVAAYLAVQVIKEYAKMEELLPQLGQGNISRPITDDDLLDSGL